MSFKISNLAAGFYKPVSFAACSYLNPKNHYRKRIISTTLLTWHELLDLPFTERIFLDDRSPDFAASKLFHKLNLVDKFDRFEYTTLRHPPHSNFGIVGTLNLASTPYILHLDDDVSVVAPSAICFDWIDRCIRIMDADSSIFGCYLGRVGPETCPWSPGKPYPTPLGQGFHHPLELFGTTASIIRRELLDRVGLAQIRKWGEKQPDNWEVLVSEKPENFLMNIGPTPFLATDNSYFFSSTKKPTLRSMLRHFVRKHL